MELDVESVPARVGGSVSAGAVVEAATDLFIIVTVTATSTTNTTTTNDNDDDEKR